MANSKILIWPWRPVYDAHELAERVNALPKNGDETVRVFPLWWALVIGCVFVFVGVAAMFGKVGPLISEQEWREKHDLLDLFKSAKKG